DRVNAGAMLYVLTSSCRDRLSACGFTQVSRSGPAVRLGKVIGNRRVDVTLFTSSLPDEATRTSRLLSAYLEQESLSRSVKAQFYRELVESDVVFYMGHSRLGGSIGFYNETGATTALNAVLRLPMVPVLEALRQRPTDLKIMGMFSCDSNGYFRQAFHAANPALSLILTTGDMDFAPAEQASLGALESVLSKKCGRAFADSMVSVTDPDPAMTRLYRGQ